MRTNRSPFRRSRRSRRRLHAFEKFNRHTDGSVDTTYGTNGVATAAFPGGGYFNFTRDMAIQSDDKIVLLGKAQIGDSFVLARLTTSGSLDTTFGSGGIATTDFTSGQDDPWALALQGDGKIIVGGDGNYGASGGDDLALARFNSDGTLDTTFGTSGKVLTLRSGRYDTVENLAIQADGGILARGATFIIRYDGGEGEHQRFYVTQDANWNVTALIGTDGQVKERFQYSPYGQRTVLTSNWTPTTDAYRMLYCYQGGRTDPVTGLIEFDNRIYNPALGTWMQQDPAGYVDGMSLYQFVQGNPIDRNDPLGLGGVTSAITLITTSKDYQIGDSSFKQALDGQIEAFAKSHACGNGHTTLYYHGSIQGQVGAHGNAWWFLYGQAVIGRFYVKADASADVTWSTSGGTTTVDAPWTISMTCIDPWHLHTTWLGWDPVFYWRNWNWTEYHYSSASAPCPSCKH